MVKDPVCKMPVDEKKPFAMIHYKGFDYYFCSANCKEAFEDNPEIYMEDPDDK
jgi:P-type Cu+ transporter